MRHLAGHLVRSGAVSRAKNALNQSQENQTAKTGVKPNDVERLLDSWDDPESRARFEREIAERAVTEAAQKLPPPGKRVREVEQRTKRDRSEPARQPRVAMVSASMSAEEFERVRAYVEERRITVSSLIRMFLLPLVGMDPHAKLEPKKRRKY